MNKALMLALVIGVVFISGCTGTSSVGYNENAGGIINSMSFDFADVYDDEDITLSVEIENVGGKEISSTDLFIYGPVIDGSGNTWSVKSSVPSVDSSSGYIYDSLPTAEFQPPSPEEGIPGMGKEYTVVLTPPNLEDGMSLTQEFNARLCFPYSTATTTQVDITSKNELRATGVTNTQASTINAAGPIHLSWVGSANLRPTASELPLVFEVSNVGGGFATEPGVACGVDIDTADRGYVEVTVTVDGDSNIDCGDGTNSAIVKLKSGSTGTVYCNYAFPSTGAPTTTFLVNAKAEYKYYVDKSASIPIKDSSID